MKEIACFFSGLGENLRDTSYKNLYCDQHKGHRQGVRLTVANRMITDLAHVMNYLPFVPYHKVRKFGRGGGVEGNR